MKNHQRGLAPKVRRRSRLFVRQPSYRHDPLLINSLTAFNFRPPLMLVFPGERITRVGDFS